MLLFFARFTLRYSTMGVVQWTAWEACFMHAYATGKLPYVSDAEVVSSPIELVRWLAKFGLPLIACACLWWCWGLCVGKAAGDPVLSTEIFDD